MSKPSKPPKNIVSATDQALLRERYEFVPSHCNNNTKGSATAHASASSGWQDRMVQRYHDNLYKEFALADLSRPGKLGLRWRTRQEVVDGRGDQSCGNKRCFESDDLMTLEVPFAYQEGGVTKKELVKLRLCPRCKPFVKSNNSKSDDSQGEKKPRVAERRQRHSKDGDGEGSLGSSDDSTSDNDSTGERRRRRKRRKEAQKRERKRRRSDDKNLDEKNYVVV